MAFIDEENNSIISVSHDNCEYRFKRDDMEVELVFVRTKFRMSDEITGQFESVDDIPDEVISELKRNGYTIVKVTSKD